MKMVFIDCETTGVDPLRHGLAQMAGSIIVNGVCLDKFNIMARPFKSDEIEPEALKVNGLDTVTLDGYPEPRHAYLELMGILGRHCDKFDRKDKYHFIGYNADFDASFVRRFFEKCGDKYFGSFFWWPILDVSKLAGMRLMATRHQLPNFKLMTVAKHLGISVDESKAHDAMYDIEKTMAIWDILMPEDLKAVKVGKAG